MAGNELDVRKATEITVKYLESVYGSLNTALFRIEEVQKNTENTRYYVICSLLTSLGSAKRTYYIIKVDIATESLVSINKGLKDDKTGKIDWQKIDFPSEEE